MTASSPSRVLNGLSPAGFLRDHWQKEPLYVAAAIPSVVPALTADELGWLAMQEDVESRLVFTERKGEKAAYRLENGPFSESRLSSLPDRDWTLLVQDVDKHLPAFRQHFEHVDFIPDWRIDDLMVSFAAPGGSVGPHVDRYDVFLLQGTGRREWRITTADEARADTSATGLSLVLPFEPRSVHTVSQGDLLYLPPGVPHWGIAVDQCMTYSIGMRAPTRTELDTGAARVLDLDEDLDDERAAAGTGVFYGDADLEVAEARPGCIHPRTIQRLREQHLFDSGMTDEKLAEVFGSVVTDPKAWMMPEPAAQVRRQLEVHGMAKLAWYEDSALRLAFANGLARPVDAEQLGFMRTLCEARRMVLPTNRQASLDQFLEWLRLQGIFDDDSGPE